MSTIPASQLANVNPSVESAGGNAVDVVGLVLTTSTRPPIGQVLGFPNGAAVASYFGSSSTEAIMAQGGAGKGAGYFGGFTNASKVPGVMYFAQYNQVAVGAYLRGGNISALTLSALQAISGSLNVTIDGYPRNASAVNLSSATSFTSAAGIIQTALNAVDPSEATVTASIGATFTGTQSGTNLTTTSVTGLISVGDTIAGTGVASGTKIVSQTSGTPGGAGVYVTSLSGTASSASCTASSNVLDVTNTASGTIAIGQTVTGAGVTPAIITALGTGTGANGTYVISGSPQQIASESMTLEGTPVAVSFDSVSGAFTIASGITGTPSTAAFATGTIAASLLLTQATGAVTSQGAAAASPSAFMNALTTINQNWVTFTTAFDPDNGSGNTVKQAFAAWKNAQNNRYAYICWDGDLTAEQSVPATGSLGYILANNSDSGTALIFDPTNGSNLAAFVMGSAAAIDFTQKGGRISFAYKAQAGLVATVTDPTSALNLGGNPQDAVSTDRGNGYNFYGAYANANQNFVWFQRGFVTGPYLWLDSYINQVWLNTLLQSALLTLQQNSRSIPYSVDGNAAIESALADPISQAKNFGAFGPAPLSSSQIQKVNSDAGAQISDVLQTQGYYLQIKPALPTVRAARSSPPATFWYIDQGSVQAINLNSVALL